MTRVPNVYYAFFFLMIPFITESIATKVETWTKWSVIDGTWYCLTSLFARRHKKFSKKPHKWNTRIQIRPHRNDCLRFHLLPYTTLDRLVGRSHFEHRIYFYYERNTIKKYCQFYVATGTSLDYSNKHHIKFILWSLIIASEDSATRFILYLYILLFLYETWTIIKAFLWIN